MLEKASGQVKRVINGVIQPTPVLDLAVNSELGARPAQPGPAPELPRDPSVYVRWTESSTGADSQRSREVPLLGNRVDRFVWNGIDAHVRPQHLIPLRARQTDNVVAARTSRDEQRQRAAITTAA